MARSARAIVQDFLETFQAKKEAYRRAWQGSGVWTSDFKEQDERLLQSLQAARDVLEDACYGVNDPGFLAKLDRWTKLEWGGYLDRATFTLKETADAPAT